MTPVHVVGHGLVRLRRPRTPRLHTTVARRVSGGFGRDETGLPVAVRPLSLAEVVSHSALLDGTRKGPCVCHGNDGGDVHVHVGGRRVGLPPVQGEDGLTVLPPVSVPVAHHTPRLLPRRERSPLTGFESVLPVRPFDTLEVETEQVSPEGLRTEGVDDGHSGVTPGR